MSAFDRRYEPDQVDAFVHAYLDRKIRPLRVVVDMAAKGQLLTRDGRETRPFEANPYTMRGYITAERRRRTGKGRGSALDKPDDMLEGLRRRLIAVADQEMTHAERKRRGSRDIPHLSQIARLIREANALPKPGENRSRAPGSRDENGHKPDGTSKGIAGRMLAAHRRETTATEPPIEDQTPTENTDAAQHSPRSEDTDEVTYEPPSAPGSLHSEAGSQVQSTQHPALSSQLRQQQHSAMHTQIPVSMRGCVP